MLTHDATEGQLEPLTQDDSYVFRAVADYQSVVPAFVSKLSAELKKSFAPPEMLFDEVMHGYDPHFLMIAAATEKDKAKGLLVFNQDSGDASRVNLYHLSALDTEKFEEILDVSLSYIWKTMHNQTVRIFLHHYL